MSRLIELQDKARAKLKGQRVLCEECTEYRYCSQVFAYGKPSGGNVRYELTLNGCPHKVYGTTRDFKILTPDHENYSEIITKTNPFSV